MSFTFCVSGCGSLCLFPSASGRSFSDGEWAGCWCVNSRKSFGVIYCYVFFLTVFGFTLGPWATQPQVLGHPSSIRSKFHGDIWRKEDHLRESWAGLPLLLSPPRQCHKRSVGVETSKLSCEPEVTDSKHVWASIILAAVSNWQVQHFCFPFFTFSVKGSGV